MNSRPTISVSKFSGGLWPEEPPEPPRRPAGSDLIAKVLAWLTEQAPRMRLWLSGPVPFASVWSSLTALAPATFARYLITFFIGVVATLLWQSYRSGTKEETVAAAPAVLDSMRQSIDGLAAEITRMRTVEQDILQRVSAPPPQPAPPQPVAAPARSPASRSSPVRRQAE